MIVSLVTVGYNGKTTGGSKGLAFVAFWSGLLVVAYAIVGSVGVYSAKGVDLFTIGTMIGMGVMLAQLFFVLMWVYYIHGQEAAQNGYVSEGADNAMGSICFFNLIVYTVWSIILIVHRAELGVSGGSINSAQRSDANAHIDGEDYEH